MPPVTHKHPPPLQASLLGRLLESAGDLELAGSDVAPREGGCPRRDVLESAGDLEAGEATAGPVAGTQMHAGGRVRAGLLEGWLRRRRAWVEGAKDLVGVGVEAQGMRIGGDCWDAGAANCGSSGCSDNAAGSDCKPACADADGWRLEIDCAGPYHVRRETLDALCQYVGEETPLSLCSVQDVLLTRHAGRPVHMHAGHMSAIAEICISDYRAGDGVPRQAGDHLPSRVLGATREARGGEVQQVRLQVWRHLRSHALHRTWCLYAFVRVSVRWQLY